MKLILALFILGVLSPSVGFSAPDKLEIIFMSQSRTASIINYLSKQIPTTYNIRVECVCVCLKPL